MTHEAPILLFKSVLALVGSGVIYVAQPIVAQVSSAPDWIHALGLPVAMLLLALAALVGMFKALSEERKARISDRDQYILQLREDAKAASLAREAEAHQARETREKLIAATIEQTHEFRGLKESIRHQER